jgi:hypothetical protein
MSNSRYLPGKQTFVEFTPKTPEWLHAHGEFDKATQCGLATCGVMFEKREGVKGTTGGLYCCRLCSFRAYKREMAEKGVMVR